MTVQHGEHIYPNDKLFPIQLPSLVGDTAIKFTLRFFCRSAHLPLQGAPLLLCFGAFTRNIPQSSDETIYGFHQEEIDCEFPIEII